MRNLVSKYLRLAHTEGILHASREAFCYIRELLLIKLRVWIQRRRHGEFMIRNTPGGRMKVDIQPDRLTLEGEMDTEVTNKIKKILKQLEKNNSDIFFFELGAHHGYYSLIAANVLESGTVVAIEPSPTNVPRLRENVELNSYQNVHIHECALDEKKGERNFAILDSTQRHRFLKEHHTDRPEKNVNVKTKKFDDIISEEYNIPNQVPVVMRIDVEYHEEEVINGMSNFLSDERSAYIIIEIHNTASHSGHHAVEKLLQHGFALRYLNSGEHDDEAILEDIRERKTNVELLATRVSSDTVQNQNFE